MYYKLCEPAHSISSKIEASEFYRTFNTFISEETFLKGHQKALEYFCIDNKLYWEKIKRKNIWQDIFALFNVSVFLRNVCSNNKNNFKL